jgi:DNA transformation protein
MATSEATINFLLDQLTALPNVTAKKMFGEYCLYLAGKPVALVCDDQLYLKLTSAGKSMAQHVSEAAPYPGAKPHILITADYWEDRDWLIKLIQATDKELPLPKSRKKKNSQNQL